MSKNTPEREVHLWEATSFTSNFYPLDLQPPASWELSTAAELAEHSPGIYEALTAHTSDEMPQKTVEAYVAPAACSDVETEGTSLPGALSAAPAASTHAEVSRTHHRKEKRQKPRYEELSTARKIARKVRIGSLIAALVLPCGSDVSSEELYAPPSLQYADPNADRCPPGTTIGAFNAAGLGDNMIGVYSARQEAHFLSDQKDLCFAGLVYGTDLDNFGNVNVFHDYIEKNNLKRVIIFAFSFGGIAMIDMLNEYHKQYPNSNVDVVVAFVSSPAEFDDLQPAQQNAVRALSIGPLDKASVKVITYLSIVKNGDKNLLSKQVNDDADVAASHTPARLVWEETLRLILGMNESDMDIATAVVYDVNDEIVNMPRAVESLVQHTGIEYLKVVPMTHSDHLMNNHAAAWWIANNKDYREPFLTVIDASRKEFARKDNVRKLAQCAVRGKVILRLAC